MTLVVCPSKPHYLSFLKESFSVPPPAPRRGGLFGGQEGQRSANTGSSSSQQGEGLNSRISAEALAALVLPEEHLYPPTSRRELRETAAALQTLAALLTDIVQSDDRFWEFGQTDSLLRSIEALTCNAKVLESGADEQEVDMTFEAVH